MLDYVIFFTMQTQLQLTFSKIYREKTNQDMMINSKQQNGRLYSVVSQ